MAMTSKLFLCLALILCGAWGAHSAGWPNKAASVYIGTTRAQVNRILRVWNGKTGYVLTVGSFTVESYWVSKDWMVTVWYDDRDGEGNMSNCVASPVTIENLTYPLNLNSEQRLLEAFKNAKVFYLQAWVGNMLAALHDTNILQNVMLVNCLANEDRHVRANAAYVFAALGDSRGFDTLRGILADRSPRPEAQGVPGNWTLQAQIVSDRYFAAHVLGDLKDPRGIPILIRNYIPTPE